MKKIRLKMDKVFIAEVEVYLGETIDPKHNAETTTIDKIDKKGNICRRIYRIHLENKKDFYALIHETIHLVERIFTDRGIPFTKENAELIAYYQTFWFKQIWRKINKKND